MWRGKTTPVFVTYAEQSVITIRTVEVPKGSRQFARTKSADSSEQDKNTRTLETDNSRKNTLQEQHENQQVEAVQQDK